jgi:hypothetical protein
VRLAIIQPHSTASNVMAKKVAPLWKKFPGSTLHPYLVRRYFSHVAHDRCSNMSPAAARPAHLPYSILALCIAVEADPFQRMVQICDEIGYVVPSKVAMIQQMQQDFERYTSNKAERAAYQVVPGVKPKQFTEYLETVDVTAVQRFAPLHFETATEPASPATQQQYIPIHSDDQDWEAIANAKALQLGWEQPAQTPTPKPIQAIVVCNSITQLAVLFISAIGFNPAPKQARSTVTKARPKRVKTAEVVAVSVAEDAAVVSIDVIIERIKPHLKGKSNKRTITQFLLGTPPCKSVPNGGNPNKKLKAWHPLLKTKPTAVPVAILEIALVHFQALD